MDICINTHTYICLCLYTFLCTCIYVGCGGGPMHVSSSTYTKRSSSGQPSYVVFQPFSIYIHIHIYLYTYIHTYTFVYDYTCSYVHVYMWGVWEDRCTSPRQRTRSGRALGSHLRRTWPAPQTHHISLHRPASFKDHLLWKDISIKTFLRMKFTARNLSYYKQRTCFAVNFIARKIWIVFSFHIESPALTVVHIASDGRDPPPHSRCEPRSYVKRELDWKLSGNAVYYTNSLISLVKNMLCSEWPSLPESFNKIAPKVSRFMQDTLLICSGPRLTRRVSCTNTICKCPPHSRYGVVSLEVAFESTFALACESGPLRAVHLWCHKWPGISQLWIRISGVPTHLPWSRRGHLAPFRDQQVMSLDEAQSLLRPSTCENSLRPC